MITNIYCKKIIQGILSPIISNMKYFILLIVLLYTPSLSYWIKNYCPYLRTYGIFALPMAYFSAYIICLFVSLFKNKYNAIIKRSIFIFLYLLIVVETYIIIYFGTRFSPAIITMVLETNTSEASGFLKQYLLSSTSWKYFLGVVLFTLVMFLLKRTKFEHLNVAVNNLTQNKPFKLLIFIITSLSLFLGTYRTGRELIWHKYSIDEIGRIRKYAFYTTLYNTPSTLYDAIRLYYLSSRDIPVLINSLKNTNINNCKYLSKNIVLVIGESFNKHHSNLYGYPLPTNPLLNEEKNLYVMQDVITTDRATSLVLKNIFSFRTKDNGKYWAHSTLFPALFKKAGYYCSFVSNQEVEETKFADVYDMANGYLVHPELIPYLWNYTNNVKYQYDMDLINEYANNKSLDNPYTLTVFHLLGQHSAYVDRYPKDYNFFTEKDYKHRTDLSTKQKQFVAQYDNAIRYGDAVLKSIIDIFRDDDAIIIFLSDHGEEIYDYRDYMGRSHEPIITKDMAKYIFDVPFIIWVSDKYAKNNPDIINHIKKSTNKPFVIDDIPHLLLNLAGIQCKEYEHHRSLICEDNYVFRRIIHDSMQDYDQLQKATF